jgi:hypothetical protein
MLRTMAWRIVSISACMLCIVIIISELFAPLPVAYAHATQQTGSAGSCPQAIAPTNQSLLIVLLDRSGSLTVQPGATDPDGYSTSVTKALADLWPGRMAVIPFSNGQASILGPATLSDPVQQADLKNKIESYPIGGDTPLGSAVHVALNLLLQNRVPAGSRVILITDGNPTGSGNNDGPHQELDIRHNLLPQFCQRGVPINVFGLTIASNTPDGQDANKLLSDVAANTSASYTNVKGPQDLAREVITLYAQWQHLTFTEVPSSPGSNYRFSIDTFAKQVSLVSFRSRNSSTITLIGPDNHPVTQGILRSTDRHYEIDNFNVSGPLVAGTYIVNTGGDPDARVYALVSSPLRIQLIEPVPTTIAYTNQSVPLQAQFMDDNGPITPEADAAQVVAHVTLLINGQVVSTNTIVLGQQKTTVGSQTSPTPIFSGGTIVYKQPGELRIEIVAIYQQAQRQSSLTLPLRLPPPPSQPKQQTQMDYKAFIIEGSALLVSLLVLAVIIFLIMQRRRAQPKPYGYITNGKPNGYIALDGFSKAIINSHDIQARGLFNFSLNFELAFTKDGTIKIRTKDPGVMIDVPGKPRPEEVTSIGVELKPGRKIYMNGKKVASFETSMGKRWI